MTGFIKLEEIASRDKKPFAMGPFGSNIKSENYIDEKADAVPVIRGLNLKGEKLDTSNLVYLSREKAESLKNSFAFPNDIVFVAQGNVGSVGIIPENTPYPKYVLSQNLMKVSVDKNIADPLFVYFYFTSRQGKYEIRKYINTTGVPCISRPLSSLKLFEIPNLTIEEQLEISQILSSLDDKISLLRRQNETLEQIAQTIFRHWFVDFEFPNEHGKPYKSSGGKFVSSELGDIPESWQVGKLGDEFEIVMGQSPPGESYNEDGDGVLFFQGRTDFRFRFPQPRLYTNRPKRMAEIFDTLVSVRAPVGDINLSFSECCIGRGLSAVKNTNKSYCLYKLKDLRRVFAAFESEGTVFGALNKNDFNNIRNIIPGKPIINVFEEVIQPFDQKIYNNYIQIQNLLSTRENLLPRLMSGTIRIK